MISQDNYIYSKSALARVLNINPKLIVRLEAWASVVFVVIKGKRPTFISKKVFKKEFIDFRKRNSELIKITPHAVSQTLFLGQSKPKKSKDEQPKLHKLEIFTTYDNLIKSRCDCEDYKNLKERRFYLNRELGKIDLKCKHQLALESFLGGSLTDYIQELKAIDEEDKYRRAKADLFGDYAGY